MWREPEPGAGRVLLVTGLSGAGRTSCLKILEDLGYEAVDNVPVALLERLIRVDDGGSGPLAIGIDSRTRGLDPNGLAEHWARVVSDDRRLPTLLFLDCDDDVLLRRFSETRRRHPFRGPSAITSAIAHERQHLAPLKAAADLVIDTSRLALGDLRRILTGHFGESAAGLRVTVTSFSFKFGLPREADVVIDVRFLRNPHWDDALRPQTGHDEAVRDYVREDPDFTRFTADLERLLTPLLPRYASEGKSYLTIAIGCTGGRHRSVFVAAWLGALLAGAGWNTLVRHRDLPQQAADRPGSRA